MKILSASEFRNNAAKVLNLVAYGGERVILGRRGKPVVAVVSLEDLALLQRVEDQRDLALAKEAKEEIGEDISWDDLKKELSL